MNTKNRIHSRVLFALCVMFASTYIIYELQHTPKLTSDPTIDAIMKNAQTHTPVENNSLPTHTDSETPSLTRDNIFTNADAYENIRWHSDRGFFSEEEQETYKNYDVATLEAMAKNNDMHAFDMLGDKAITQGNTQKVMEYYWSAATLGSTAVFAKLANMSTEPDVGLNETKEERSILRRAGTIEALAILKTASIRGDLATATTTAKTIKNGYEILEKKPLVLTEEELERIDVRAIEIFDQLQARRNAMGLNNFDNSTTKIVDEIYKKNKKS